MVEAKVNMIRDAQCSEKQIIKKEVDTEENRLDHEMEVDRVNAIRIEEEIARKRKNERMIGAMMIMDQIKHNEQVCPTSHSGILSRLQGPYNPPPILMQQPCNIYIAKGVVRRV